MIPFSNKIKFFLFFFYSESVQRIWSSKAYGRFSGIMFELRRFNFVSFLAQWEKSNDLFDVKYGNQHGNWSNEKRVYPSHDVLGPTESRRIYEGGIGFMVYINLQLQDDFYFHSIMIPKGFQITGLSYGTIDQQGKKFI